MKIGILSMQRVINYGSFLQAFALKETLTQLGADCSFIDIKPGPRIFNNNVRKKKNKIIIYLERIDKYFFKRIKHQIFIRKRKEMFFNEFFPILGLSKKPNYNSNYDVVVIGSDEVFNCARDVEWGFAKTLLGEGLNSKKVITYAASCGHTTLEQLEKFGLKSVVSNAMKNIDTVSVRDENTKNFVKALTNKEACENVDPVFIYDFKEKVPDKIPYRNYILVYAYDNRINDMPTINEIRAFSRKKNKKIISAGVYQNWADLNILCSPFELLAYFRDADYVVTDTFHGTVFSIKYNKQFATIVRDSNRQKLGYLLKKFRLSDREIKDINEMELILSTKPNYEYANKLIKIEKEKAIKYLCESIGLKSSLT